MYTTQRATPSASRRWYTRVTGSNLSPMAVWREVHAATPTLLLVLPLPPAISNGSSVGLPSLFPFAVCSRVPQMPFIMEGVTG